MNQSERKQLFNALEDLAAAFPSQPMLPRTIAVYVKGLEDLPIDLLLSAIAELPKTCEYLPKVVEIRDEVYTVDRQQAHQAFVENLRPAWNQRRSELREPTGEIKSLRDIAS